MSEFTCTTNADNYQKTAHYKNLTMQYTVFTFDVKFFDVYSGFDIKTWTD